MMNMTMITNMILRIFLRCDPSGIALIKMTQEATKTMVGMKTMIKVDPSML